MSRAPALAALLTAALALGACGGDEVFRTDRPILRITLDEYRIVPQDVVVRPGRMKFTVRNTGTLTHNLAVQDPDGADGRPEDLPAIGPVEGPDGTLVLAPRARSTTLHPPRATGGDPSTATFKVDLRPGEYVLVCTIANHDDLGQFGSLRVEE